MKAINTIKLNESEKRLVWEILNQHAQKNQSSVYTMDAFRKEQAKRENEIVLAVAKMFTPGMSETTITVEE